MWNSVIAAIICKDFRKHSEFNREQIGGNVKNPWKVLLFQDLFPGSVKRFKTNV